eukprot:11854713-Alexandrium_andersonii.AAC.1
MHQGGAAQRMVQGSGAPGVAVLPWSRAPSAHALVYRCRCRSRKGARARECSCLLYTSDAADDM